MASARFIHICKILRSHLSVAHDGGADLLRTGSDGERGLGADPVFQCLSRDARRTRHVLIGAVRAAANQSYTRIKFNSDAIWVWW